MQPTRAKRSPRIRTKGTPLFKQATREFQKEFLRRELERHGGNRTHTAESIGITRVYLVKLIRDLGLERNPIPGVVGAQERRTAWP